MGKLLCLDNQGILVAIPNWSSCLASHEAAFPDGDLGASPVGVIWSLTIGDGCLRNNRHVVMFFVEYGDSSRQANLTRLSVLNLPLPAANS